MSFKALSHIITAHEQSDNTVYSFLEKSQPSLSDQRRLVEVSFTAWSIIDSWIIFAITSRQNWGVDHKGIFRGIELSLAGAVERLLLFAMIIFICFSVFALLAICWAFSFMWRSRRRTFHPNSQKRYPFLQFFNQMSLLGYSNALWLVWIAETKIIPQIFHLDTETSSEPLQIALRCTLATFASLFTLYTLLLFYFNDRSVGFFCRRAFRTKTKLFEFLRFLLTFASIMGFVFTSDSPFIKSAVTTTLISLSISSSVVLSIRPFLSVRTQRLLSSIQTFSTLMALIFGMLSLFELTHSLDFFEGAMLAFICMLPVFRLMSRLHRYIRSKVDLQTVGRKVTVMVENFMWREYEPCQTSKEKQLVHENSKGTKKFLRIVQYLAVINQHSHSCQAVNCKCHQLTTASDRAGLSPKANDKAEYQNFKVGLSLDLLHQRMQSYPDDFSTHLFAFRFMEAFKLNIGMKLSLLKVISMNKLMPNQIFQVYCIKQELMRQIRMSKTDPSNPKETSLNVFKFLDSQILLNMIKEKAIKAVEAFARLTQALSVNCIPLSDLKKLNERFFETKKMYQTAVKPFEESKHLALFHQQFTIGSNTI